MGSLSKAVTRHFHICSHALNNQTKRSLFLSLLYLSNLLSWNPFARMSIILSLGMFLQEMRVLPSALKEAHLGFTWECPGLVIWFPFLARTPGCVPLKNNYFTLLKLCNKNPLMA